MSDVVTGERFMIRRKVFTIFGAKFHVYDPEGGLIGFSKQKAFKLKEDIRVYSDETMTHERVCIRARNVIDFSAAYDVIDSESGAKIGALRRKGWTSIFRDAWQILDESDHVVAEIKEDSGGMAFLRRFLTNLIPQTFYARNDRQLMATYKQRFNPFVFKMDVTIEPDALELIDRRVLLGAGVLLVAIEGRQG